jgi:hypothetical protein
MIRVRLTELTSPNRSFDYLKGYQSIFLRKQNVAPKFIDNFVVGNKFSCKMSFLFPC